MPGLRRRAGPGSIWRMSTKDVTSSRVPVSGATSQGGVDAPRPRLAERPTPCPWPCPGRSGRSGRGSPPGSRPARPWRCRPTAFRMKSGVMARSSSPATCTAAWSRMLPAKMSILPVLKASTVMAWLSPLVGKNVTSSPSVRPMRASAARLIGHLAAGELGDADGRARDLLGRPLGDRAVRGHHEAELLAVGRLVEGLQLPGPAA